MNIELARADAKASASESMSAPLAIGAHRLGSAAQRGEVERAVEARLLELHGIWQRAAALNQTGDLVDVVALRRVAQVLAEARRLARILLEVRRVADVLRHGVALLLRRERVEAVGRRVPEEEGEVKADDHRAILRRRRDELGDRRARAARLGADAIAAVAAPKLDGGAPEMADLEAGVQAMTAIVGDVGHGVLLSLLRREKGDVQRALNAFYDGSAFAPAPAPRAVAPAPAPPPEYAAVFGAGASSSRGGAAAAASSSRGGAAAAASSSRSPDEAGWPRLLATAAVTGMSLSRLSSIQPGTPLVFRRASAPAPKPSRGGGRGARGGRGGGRQAPLFAPRPAPAASTIVRFGLAAADGELGRELGRLPADLADALAPLLDARHCSLSGECGALPAAGVGIADPFPLRLSVFVARAAFSAAAAAPSTNEGASAAAAAAQRYAFVRLLERLRVPQEVAPVDDASDGGAALEPPPAAAAPSAAAGDEEGTIDAGELDTLYERLGCDAAALRRLGARSRAASSARCTNIRCRDLGG